MSWQAEGPCGDEDPELFFPQGEGRLRLLQIQQAKSVCDRCPVSQQCLDWALEHWELTSGGGIWGGYTLRERRKFLRAYDVHSKLPPAS